LSKVGQASSLFLHRQDACVTIEFEEVKTFEI